MSNLIKNLVSPAAEPWGQLAKFSLVGLLLLGIMAALFAAGLGYANILIGFLAIWFTFFSLLKPYNVTSVAVVGLIGAVFSSAPGAFNKARQSVRTVTWGYIQAVCWILMLMAVLSAVFSIRLEDAVDPTTTASGSWSVAEFIAGVFRLLLLGVAAVAMSVAFELSAGAWKTRIIVFVLLLIGAVTVWTMGLNTLTSAAVDKGASMLPAAKATVSSVTTTKPSTNPPATESVVFDIPAEGGLVVMKSNQMSILKVPADMESYMNQVVGASPADVDRGSHNDFITAVWDSPTTIRWIPKPEAFKKAGRDQVEILVKPRTKAENEADGIPLVQQ